MKINVTTFFFACRSDISLFETEYTTGHCMTFCNLFRYSWPSIKANEIFSLVLEFPYNGEGKKKKDAVPCKLPKCNKNSYHNIVSRKELERK